MSELTEISDQFKGLQEKYKQYLPKVDSALTYDLFLRQMENPSVTPMYTVEVFTKPGLSTEEVREFIIKKTGTSPAIYDNGTHYIINQKLTIETLKEISEYNDVLEITGKYTGGIGVGGVSQHEYKERQIIRKYHNPSTSSTSSKQHIQKQQTSYDTSIDTLREIKTVFQGLQTLYQTYLPKADPTLIHDLLVREKEKSEDAPFYMVEIFTKPGTDSEAMKNKIFERTGWLPTVFDKGTHYATNQRLTLETLKEISDSDEVLEVTGDYTGSIGGWGASHEQSHKEYNRTIIPYSAAPAPQSLQSIDQEKRSKENNNVKQYFKHQGKRTERSKYQIALLTSIGIVGAIALAGFIISGGMLPNVNQNNNTPTPTTLTTTGATPPGALHGYVSGPSGLPAIGASIIAANQETGYTENAIISLNGQYFLNNLPQGEYIVMVAYPDGTNKVVNDFQLESGINHELDFSY
jgi:hypothetical protein